MPTTAPKPTLKRGVEQSATCVLPASNAQVVCSSGGFLVHANACSVPNQGIDSQQWLHHPEVGLAMALALLDQGPKRIKGLTTQLLKSRHRICKSISVCGLAF